MDNALDELRLTPTRKGPPCSYELVRLDEVDKATLDLALKRTDITSRAIEVWLTGKGVTWRTFNISRHRRGDCRCPR
jgi:hypothetical protein